jgi:DivIVA domain-containing protein
MIVACSQQGSVMPLTPDEVRRHRFDSSPWGYRKEQVLFFLSQVAVDYETAIDAIAEAGAGVPERDEIDVLLGSARSTTMALRRAAALVALANHANYSALDPLMRSAAETLDQAVELLEAANERMRVRKCQLDREQRVQPEGHARVLP